MHLPEKYISLLYQKGFSLQNPGLEEKALRRNDALDAIDILRNAKVPISGGDVYVRHGAEIKPAYDNWSVRKEENPENSWMISENYIKNYPDLNKHEPLFVLVPKSL